MSSWQMKTPVAFFIFNRPDRTKIVFEAIAKAKPPKLLVIADGPRADRPEETRLCDEAREVIQSIDWECEVLMQFSDENMGCRKRVSSGIDWVFEQVPEAIILEDDCLPHASFFRYCQDLLEHYRFDTRIMAISGDNFQFGQDRGDSSYYYSQYNHVWGWASWRRAWQFYDVNMALWPVIRDGGWLEHKLGSVRERKYWTEIFDKVHKGDIDTWDYQWTFTCWIQNGLIVLPQKNLVSNIGFGMDATHTLGESVFAELPVYEMGFPLSHPDYMLQNSDADAYTSRLIFKQKGWMRGISKMRNFLTG